MTKKVFVEISYKSYKILFYFMLFQIVLCSLHKLFDFNDFPCKITVYFSNYALIIFLLVAKMIEYLYIK